MKHPILLSLVLIATLGISACTIKDPKENLNKDLDQKIGQDMTKYDDLLKSLTTEIEKGGQPGPVKISGVIVKDDSIIDDRITVKLKTGLSKSGVEAPLAKDSVPVLSSKMDTFGNIDLTAGKNLITVGCDKGVATKFARERSLTLASIPAPYTEAMMVVQAKTLLMCNALKDFSFAYVSYLADEVIMKDVNFEKTASKVGGIYIAANKLVLIGNNKISVRGPDSTLTSLPFTIVGIEVAKEIFSENDGKLLVESTGGNYKETPTAAGQ